MRVKYTRHYLTGQLAGLPVEEFYVPKDVEDARYFVLTTEDLHLQYELSGGTEGWSIDEQGDVFFYTGAVICKEGNA